MLLSTLLKHVRSLRLSTRIPGPYFLLIGLQKTSYPPGTSSFHKIKAIGVDMFRQEGFRAFYKGITPRVLRVAPGQAVVFPVYEKVRQIIERVQGDDDMGDTYSE